MPTQRRTPEPVDPLGERIDRWRPALINGGSAAVLALVGWLVEGRLSVPVMLGVAFALGWAWWVSPLRQAEPHVPHARAMADTSPHDLIVYWRPGCSQCMRLWRALDADVRAQVTWVNVMADVDGARFIRQYHDGDMVTPTAVTGAGRQMPATPESVTARVQQRGTA